MRDHHQGARPAVEEVLEHVQGLDVEVVGGLVEEQHVGLGQQQPEQLEAAALATGEVAHAGGQPVTGEAEPLQHRRGRDLAVGGPGHPPDRLDRLQHPRGGVEVLDVLGQVLQGDGATVQHLPGGRRQLAGQQRQHRGLAGPFTPTMPTRSPGPSRQVTWLSSSRSPRTRSTSSTSTTCLPSRWVANRSRLEPVAWRRLVLNQRVGYIHPEPWLGRPRRWPALKPGQLLADQVPPAGFGGLSLPVALGPGQHVRRIAALVAVDDTVVDLPRGVAHGVEEPPVVRHHDQPAGGRLDRCRASQATASTSRWLVGLSSTTRSWSPSNRAASEPTALAAGQPEDRWSSLMPRAASGRRHGCAVRPPTRGRAVRPARPRGRCGCRRGRRPVEVPDLDLAAARPARRRAPGGR